jgi:hypothetical protein
MVVYHFFILNSILFLINDKNNIWSNYIFNGNSIYNLKKS